MAIRRKRIARGVLRAFQAGYPSVWNNVPNSLPFILQMARVIPLKDDVWPAEIWDDLPPASETGNPITDIKEDEFIEANAYWKIVESLEGTFGLKFSESVLSRLQTVGDLKKYLRAHTPTPA